MIRIPLFSEDSAERAQFLKLFVRLLGPVFLLLAAAEWMAWRHGGIGTWTFVALLGSTVSTWESRRLRSACFRRSGATSPIPATSSWPPISCWSSTEAPGAGIAFWSSWHASPSLIGEPGQGEMPRARSVT
jgi:hypothetical protein